MSPADLRQVLARLKAAKTLTAQRLSVRQSSQPNAFSYLRFHAMVSCTHGEQYDGMAHLP
jgi:hypothetical protein